jgi:hypothetical protein
MENTFEVDHLISLDEVFNGFYPDQQSFQIGAAELSQEVVINDKIIDPLKKFPQSIYNKKSIYQLIYDKDFRKRTIELLHNDDKYIKDHKDSKETLKPVTTFSNDCLKFIDWIKGEQYLNPDIEKEIKNLKEKYTEINNLTQKSLEYGRIRYTIPQYLDPRKSYTREEVEGFISGIDRNDADRFSEKVNEIKSSIPQVKTFLDYVSNLMYKLAKIDSVVNPEILKRLNKLKEEAEQLKYLDKDKSEIKATGLATGLAASMNYIKPAASISSPKVHTRTTSIIPVQMEETFNKLRLDELQLRLTKAEQSLLKTKKEDEKTVLNKEINDIKERIENYKKLTK